MFYNNRNNLFGQNNISSYLYGRFGSLEQEVKNLTLERINSKDETEFIKELVQKYTVHVPTLIEDEIKVDAHEGEVEVYNQYPFYDESKTYRTTGLKITVHAPFDGDAELFNYRASTFSISRTPEGRVQGQELVFSYETVEKDSEKIKGLWKSDISGVRQNLGRLAIDVSTYNNSLENNIKALVANRKKEAADNQSLIGKIKS